VLELAFWSAANSAAKGINKRAVGVVMGGFLNKKPD
jgi:hypothetical protein